MSREEVFPQLAANMSAAFKKVWKIIGAANPSEFDLAMNRIVELAKDGVYEATSPAPDRPETVCEPNSRYLEHAACRCTVAIQLFEQFSLTALLHSLANQRSMSVPGTRQWP